MASDSAGLIMVGGPSPWADPPDAPERTHISREGEIANLEAALSAFNTVHEFVVGGIVRQKPACRLYQDLSDNGLYIVVEKFPHPIQPVKDVTTRDLGSHFFWITVDMRVGQWTPDGDFVIHHVDSRRFEPAPKDLLLSSLLRQAAPATSSVAEKE